MSSHPLPYIDSTIYSLKDLIDHIRTVEVLSTC